jgi:hypothetical protein
VHSFDSSLREQALGHIFLGQPLAFMWRNGGRDIEVLKSEVDRGGYDLVLEANGVIRHLQLKSSFRGPGLKRCSERPPSELSKQPGSELALCSIASLRTSVPTTSETPEMPLLKWKMLQRSGQKSSNPRQREAERGVPSAAIGSAASAI